MATNSLRGVLLRSLPVLLLLLTLGLTAPQTTSQVLTSAGVGHSTSATPDSIADSSADEAESDSRTPDGPVADRTRALTAQRAAGVTGSRAPPFVLA